MKTIIAASIIGALLAMPVAAVGKENGVRVLHTTTDYAEARLGHGQARITVRHVRLRNGVRRWQVQMPAGGWRNCGHDCADFYRCNVLEPWVCRSEDSGGDRSN